MAATGNRVTILAYHRIDTPANPDKLNLSPTLIDASPEAFEAQMQWLAKRYNVISAWDLVEALRNGKSLPAHAVVITFDDGYTCYVDTALPIMRKYGLPSTLFVPTAYADDPFQPFWWDTIYKVLTETTIDALGMPEVGLVPLNTKVERDAAYAALVEAIEHMEANKVPAMVEAVAKACGVEPAAEKHIIGWQEIETLAPDGDVTFAPHTRHHPILAQTAEADLQDEIQGSWEDLQQHIARPLPLLAYPNGQPHAVNRASREAARNAGLLGAVTMVSGTNAIGTSDPFLLHRSGAGAGQSITRFKLSISPVGRVLRRVKRLWRAPIEFS
jgi:peptidoglycan/xylan/chitin deacetylase (PgdA/CDA1 family)